MKNVTLILIVTCITQYSFSQPTARKYSVSETQASAIVQKVLKTSPVIDGHNDLFAWYFGCNYKKLKKCPQDIADYPLDTISKGQTDIPRWRKGGVGGVLLNVYADSLNDYLDAYDLLYRLEKEYPKDLKVVGTAVEMRTAMKADKITLLPMLEGAVRLENKPSLLRSFYKMGLRCVTFAYKTNGLADGSDDTPTHNGISSIGKEMITEMNRLGVLIDMSHISAKSMNDILDITKAPVIFSHSNARALCDVNRNVSDEVLKRLKKNNGIIMLTMVPEFTTNAIKDWMNTGDAVYYKAKKDFPGNRDTVNAIIGKWEKDNTPPAVTVVEIANHFDYVKKLIGVDCIGIGGDYDGLSFTITGMEDVSSYPKLLIELAKRGWTEVELRKISSENFLRVFEEVERTAAKLNKSSTLSLKN
jgi:membrane dipeptidase